MRRRNPSKGDDTPGVRDGQIPKGLSREYLVSLLPDSITRSIQFYRAHHWIPRLHNPRTLTEKVNWRILKDRRPILEWTCDKLAAKEFAARTSSVRVPETYWSGTDLLELSSVELPDKWVLKPYNASGMVHMGSGRVEPDEAKKLIELTAGWLRPALYDNLSEWAYAKARRLFIVEEFVGEREIPIDYKSTLTGSSTTGPLSTPSTGSCCQSGCRSRRRASSPGRRTSTG